MTEFVRRQAIANATRSSEGGPGFTREQAHELISVLGMGDFVSAGSLDSVFAHLAAGAAETHRDVVVDADSLARDFVKSLSDPELDSLARAVGSNISGHAYRATYLATLNDGKTTKVDYAVVVHVTPDGSVTYYELHRPYVDVTSLQWVDGTRIRTWRLPFAAP